MKMQTCLWLPSTSPLQVRAKRVRLAGRTLTAEQENMEGSSGTAAPSSSRAFISMVEGKHLMYEMSLDGGTVQQNKKVRRE